MKRKTVLLVAWMVSCVPGTVTPEDAVPAQLASFFAPPSELANDFGDYESPLVFYDGRQVKTPDDWQLRRREILDRWHDMMGRWPPMIEEPKIEYVEKKRREDFTQNRVRVEIAPEGRTVDGYLLVPDGDGPFPAVVVVYYDAETGVGLGKELGSCRRPLPLSTGSLKQRCQHPTSRG